MSDFYEIESFQAFSESHIWQINRDFYQQVGIEAWSKGMVPHHMTSNSMVGKTYAELILGLLTDVAAKGGAKDKVYILELGAGHGRLAFHILKHLERLTGLLDTDLPDYCMVVSDIVDQNLEFLIKHPQLQSYLEKGLLEVAYFDAIGSKEIHLQYADKTIRPKDLNQPLVAIGNYFFDSIPNDLFLIKDQEISACSISLSSKEDPKDMDPQTLLKNLQLTYQKTPLEKPFFEDAVSNEILAEYKNLLQDTHLFFPHKGIQCLNNLRAFSDKGLLLLSMDKGFHETHDLDQKKEPDIVTHGSFSLWVNYHALGRYCEKQGGKALFPSFSTFHLEIACLLFSEEAESYQYTNAAYQRFVNDYGPDDFNSLKKIGYNNVSKLMLIDLIALIRMGAYDSTFFVKLFPRLKQVSHSISTNQRNRLAQTIHQVWDLYFNINEPIDLAYELGGFFYDLGFYEEALQYFQYSINESGQKPDIYYNQVLCYFQLRKDVLFTQTLKEAKLAFPESTLFEHLDTLDLAAV